jgi:hypothetical protein
MTTFARAAVLAAAVALAGLPRLDAQSSSIRVTIAGGPHAGTYEMKDQCEVRPNSYPALYIMAFTTGTANPKVPRTMEFFTASGKGKPVGFVVAVKFSTKPGVRGTYEIFAIPRELTPSAPPLSGRGSVTVRKTATGQTAAFRGQTKDGVRMEGTVDCRARSS